MIWRRCWCRSSGFDQQLTYSIGVAEWTEATTRVVVKERSMGRCEKCGNPGAQMHHRKNRSQRGQWNPANIVYLCVKCHDWVGQYPVDAHTVGLHVLPTEDPEEVPITTGNVPFLLDIDGGFTPCDPWGVLLPIPGWAR